MRKVLFAVPLLAAMSLFVGQAAHAEISSRGLPKFLHHESDALDSKGDARGIGLFHRAVDGEKTKYVFANGKVTAVSDTSITVAVKSNKSDVSNQSESNSNTNSSDTNTNSAEHETIVTTSYTFAVDGTTTVIRKFKGKASIAEVAVGDTVRIWGTKLDGGVAKLIWDKSIWWGKVKGTVADLNTTTKTFKLILRQKQTDSGKTITVAATIHYTDTTTFWLSDGVTATTAADLSNGDVVKVRGSWNSANKYFLASKVIFQ